MDDREIVALFWKRDQRALTETEPTSFPVEVVFSSPSLIADAATNPVCVSFPSLLFSVTPLMNILIPLSFWHLSNLRRSPSKALNQTFL